MKTFEVIYQAPNGQSGLTVQMDVYDAAKAQDAAQSAVMTEIGTTGRYYGSFQAAEANWHVQISDTAGGRAVKHFGKGAYGANGVVDLIASLSTQLTTIEGKVDAIKTPPMIG